MSRHVRLDEDRALEGVDSASEESSRCFQSELIGYSGGIDCVSQSVWIILNTDALGTIDPNILLCHRMIVDNTEEPLRHGSIILNFYPILNCSQIITKMNESCRLNSTQNNLFC